MFTMKNTLVSISIPLKKVGDDFYIWMQKRQEDGPLDGFMEFPGGKIEEGEDSIDAAIREFCEELEYKGPNLRKERGTFRLFKVYQHEYSDRKVTLFTHLLNFNELEGDNPLSEKNWFKLPFDDDIEELHKMTLEANVKILNDLASYLRDLTTNNVDKYLWMS